MVRRRSKASVGKKARPDLATGQRTTSGGEQPPARRWLVPRWLIPLGLTLLVLVAYGPALSGDFVNLDDTHYLSKNADITSSASPLHFWLHAPDDDYYWPVSYTSLWALWHASHGNPFAFHLANALLHALNAILLYVLLRRYSPGRPWRLLAAALFAIHPVHAPAVAWIFQHKTVLSTTLFLLAFAAYQRADDPGRTPRSRRLNLVASVALFALAPLAKTSTIMLPPSLVLHHALTGTLAPRHWFRRLVPYAAIALVVGVLTAQATADFVSSGRLTGVSWHPDFLERLLVSAKNFWFYLVKLLVPSGYAFVYPWESADPHRAVDYVPLAMVLVATGAVVFAARRSRVWVPIAVGLGFYAVNLVPSLGFVSTTYMRYSLVADHYQYVASLGVLPLVAIALERLAARAPWRWAPIALSVVVVAGLAVLTRARARGFEDSESLWRATIVDNPSSDLAHYNLGVYLVEQGRTTEGEEHYHRTLTLNPKKVEARVNLGKLKIDRGDLTGAEAEYLAAVEADPKWASAHFGLGVVRQTQLRYGEALEAYDRALALNPKRADTWSNKCFVLIEAARPADAEQACSRALELAPNHRPALTNLGALLLRTQRFAEALPIYQRLLTIEAGNAKLHFKVAALAARLGKPELARQEGQRTLEIDPKHREASELLLQLGPR